jgi:hypothetical protein
MGEAKRRKQLDEKYGKKEYSIEFLDYESWKAEFSAEEFQESLADELDEEDLKLLFEERILWGGNIKIEDSSYPFMILIEEDDDGALDIELHVKPANNTKHERIIQRNTEKIYTEISDIIIPEYERLNEENFQRKKEKIEELLEVLQQYIDEDEDEFDEDEYEF